MKCPKCDLPKAASPNGTKYPYCRVHWNEWRRNNYRERGDYARIRDSRTHANWVRRTQYGISIDEYEALLGSQNGVCAICHRKNKSERRMAVDHNHETGKIRGILCDRCNRGLGFFGDDIDRMTKAIEYLKTRGL